MNAKLINYWNKFLSEYDKSLRSSGEIKLKMTKRASASQRIERLLSNTSSDGGS